MPENNSLTHATQHSRTQRLKLSTPPHPIPPNPTHNQRNSTNRPVGPAQGPRTLPAKVWWRGCGPLHAHRTRRQRRQQRRGPQQQQGGAGGALGVQRGPRQGPDRGLLPRPRHPGVAGGGAGAAGRVPLVGAAGRLVPAVAAGVPAGDRGADAGGAGVGRAELAQGAGREEVVGCVLYGVGFWSCGYLGVLCL